MGPEGLARGAGACRGLGGVPHRAWPQRHPAAVLLARSPGRSAIREGGHTAPVRGPGWREAESHAPAGAGRGRILLPRRLAAGRPTRPDPTRPGPPGQPAAGHGFLPPSALRDVPAPGARIKGRLCPAPARAAASPDPEPRGRHGAARCPPGTGSAAGRLAVRCVQAPGPHPGGLQRRAPPEALHGLAAGGRAARVRRAPHRRAVGAERRTLHGGHEGQGLPGAPGSPLALAAGAAQALVRGARRGAPPRQQHRDQRRRPPAPPAGGEGDPQRAREDPALPAAGRGCPARDPVRGGRLGLHQPQRAEAGRAAAGGAAGEKPGGVQQAALPRQHHHGQDAVHRLPKEGHLQGGFWRTAHL